MRTLAKIWSLVILWALSVPSFAQSHGLQFSSHEVVQEKRTSLSLSPQDRICAEGALDVSFDLMFRPKMEIYFGYVVRLINNNRQNIDLVYNQRSQQFNLVVGEDFSGSFGIDSMDLYYRWNRIRIVSDPGTGKTTLQVNGKLLSQAPAAWPAKACFAAVFGMSTLEGFETVDLPPMSIRDVEIRQDGRLSYRWDLAENTGAQSIDRISNHAASVRNPVWIQPRHQHWEHRLTLQTRGAASVAFDRNAGIITIVSVDSLYHFSLSDGSFTPVPYAAGRERLLQGNQSVYDPVAGRLVNFYPDDKTVSVYDADSRKWSSVFQPALLTEYWHVNKFISPYDTSLYVIGGYGQLRYKNSVYRYHFPTGKWDSVEASGDFFMPRYLAAAGLGTSGAAAYIIGGYGSNSGDQAINPKYNYEFFRFGLNDGSFRRIYTLPEPEMPFCFVNSLIVDSASGSFYSLVYPTNRFNSRLQLFKGSLSEPEYKIIGDTIPYPFHDVESFADVFYSPESKLLTAVTLFTGKEGISDVNIYTIGFPPNETGNVVSAEQWQGRNRLMAVAIVAGLALLIVYYARRRRRGRRTDTIRLPGGAAATATGRSATATGRSAEGPSAIPIGRTADATMPAGPHAGEPAQAGAVVPEDPAVSAVYLFGEFEVRDASGADITKLFTPLLKELFLLIVINTVRTGRGISNEVLNEILWPGKPEKDAKNNRSVNLGKLKSALEKVGSFTIARETGYWRIHWQDNVYVDYLRFRQLQPAMEPPAGSPTAQLLALIQRGNFLQNTEYNWLDDVKAEVSSYVIDRALGFISGLRPEEDAETIVELANAIFRFDRLNELALKHKCRALIYLGRHSIANTTYLKFTKEYREIYGEDFPRGFNDVIH